MILSSSKVKGQRTHTLSIWQSTYNENRVDFQHSRHDSALIQVMMLIGPKAATGGKLT